MFANRHRNNVIFSQAVRILLNILSDWERHYPDRNDGLTLELSAHSPCDAEHCFQDDAGLQPDYPHLDPIRTQRDYIIEYEKSFFNPRDLPSHKSIRRLRHGFRNPIGFNSNIQAAPLGSAAKRQIRPLQFDNSSGKGEKYQLPTVRMISSLVVRRQFYREMSPLSFGRLLREALTEL
jgi:hypothetical protein